MKLENIEFMFDYLYNRDIKPSLKRCIYERDIASQNLHEFYNDLELVDEYIMRVFGLAGEEIIPTTLIMFLDGDLDEVPDV
jgi:hypothetical protein